MYSYTIACQDPHMFATFRTPNYLLYLPKRKRHCINKYPKLFSFDNFTTYKFIFIHLRTSISTPFKGLAYLRISQPSLHLVQELFQRFSCRVIRRFHVPLAITD
jgi:hypothetical protein